MAARTFQASGRTYRDTPGGRLDAFCDEYVAKFRLRGHDVTWLKRGNVRKGSACYEVTCRKCGGVLVIGEGSTSTVKDRPRMTLYGRVHYCPGKRGR